MTCKDNRDGSCTVEYIPLEAGEYDVSIKYADQHIPGSPFKVSPSLVYSLCPELISKCVLHIPAFYVCLLDENYAMAILLVLYSVQNFIWTHILTDIT